VLRSLEKQDKDFSWHSHESMDDAEMTSSGRAFQILAAATGKARLSTVDSLRGSSKVVGLDCLPHLRQCHTVPLSISQVSMATLYCTRSGTHSQHKTMSE